MCVFYMMEHSHATYIYIYIHMYTYVTLYAYVDCMLYDLALNQMYFVGRSAVCTTLYACIFDIYMYICIQYTRVYSMNKLEKLRADGRKIP